MPEKDLVKAKFFDKGKFHRFPTLDFQNNRFQPLLNFEYEVDPSYKNAIQVEFSHYQEKMDIYNLNTGEKALLKKDFSTEEKKIPKLKRNFKL